MEGSSRAVLNYLDQLQTFHYQQGTPFTRVPMLDHKPLDLFRLKKEVLRRGGHQKVSFFFIIILLFKLIAYQ